MSERIITCGSLFSGIGGLELGLERAGMRVVWQVEKDDYCRRVLAKHWPDIERFEDVREVGAHNLKPVDLICGGFPCQDISAAGRREGIQGARSGLWFEYARIVRELRPRYVLVENVSALLVRGLDRVLGELAEGGYDAEWFVLAAADVGAPHLRERVFVLAYPASDIRRAPRHGRSQASHRRDSLLAHPRREGVHQRRLARNAAEQSSGPRRVERNGVQEGKGREGTPVADTDVLHAQGFFPEGDDPEEREIAGERSLGLCSREGNWTTEPDVGRVAHGVPSRVDRLRALGNAVVPQVAEYIGRLIVEADREAVA